MFKLRPLTRRRPNGAVYRRSGAVDAAIGAALALDPDELRLRAKIRDRDNARFLQEEVLVYLLRDARARGDDGTVTWLWNALVGRCASHIHSQLATLGAQYLDEGYNAVLREIGMHILDLSTDSGDFLQVNFWTVLRRRTISEFSRQLREKQEADAEVQLSSLAGEEPLGADEDDAETVPRLSQGDCPAGPATPLEQLERAEDHAIIDRALSVLPPIVREAFILRHREGWKIHSKDPNEMTISRALRRSDRMIRKYLEEAQARLRAWREEER